VIFRQYVGVNAVLPLWLDEGVACLEENTKDRRLALARRFLRSDSFIPLDKLIQIHDQDISSPALFYAEAVSLMDFLLTDYGKEKFVDYCRELRDNKNNWLVSLLGIYGFEDISEINKKWIIYLNEDRNPNPVQ
jgi:hypothetical protein